MSTTFNEPVMMKRYDNNHLRIVTHKEIKVGDEIVFKNERWQNESRVVTAIHEQRPSMGDFGGKRPTSYRVEY